ncbi:MAG TPA: cytochrome c3 family protein [Desulfuromonadales bacterium]|nr:cytochrome c3 family protein [Desulfuromonadales bacterium]
MLKKAIIIGIAVLSLAFVGTAFAGGMGAANMTLDSSGHMGKVAFPHHIHQMKLHNCQICHKLFPKEADAIKKGLADGSLKKMQVMNVCKSCHQKLKSEGKAAGPTNCMGCHKK